jgi:hypothetical protein
MSKSYSVTDWALHDGNDREAAGRDHVRFGAMRFQDEEDPDTESGILYTPSENAFL